MIATAERIVTCRECGARGLEDETDPCPGLCPRCLDQELFVLTGQLALLMDKPGRMIVRDAIFRHLSPDPDDFDPHRLDSLIHRLRRKVQKASAEDFPLTCVHGEGYVVLA